MGNGFFQLRLNESESKGMMVSGMVLSIGTGNE
jgi:hypothetical protein